MMEKILEKLNSIAKDKWQHFAAGLMVAAFFAVTFGCRRFMPVLSAAVIGAAKEIYDLKKSSVFNWCDLLATCLGGLVINVFAWMGALI